MLLGLQPRKPQRSIRIGSSAAPSGAVGGPTFSRHVQPSLRSDQRSVVEAPGSRFGFHRQQYTPAVQADFGSVDGSQDSTVPKFGRWLSWTVPTQRFVRPAFARYPDLHAEWEYPNFAFHENAQKPTTAASMARTGGFVRQTDFGVRRRKYRPGPRVNGLLMALQGPTQTFTLPQLATYFQERGFAIVWTQTVDPGFPTQYAGFRIHKGGVTYDLCLVATADGAAGMGGQPRLHKGGVTYAVYLVETTDPNASGKRISTTTDTKEMRLKT